MTIDWPADLVENIARRRCVVFLGSGISNNSVGQNGQRPPTWQAFLDGALDHCGNSTTHIKKLIKAGDYLSACDIIQERMGDDWTAYLRRRFVEPRYTPATIHDNIFKLDTRIFITPNFDKIFDRHALEASGGTIAIKSYCDADITEVAKGFGRYILKVHGDIDDPQNLIFTRKQYAFARTRYTGAYRVLDSLLITQSFLFIGCGLNDPDLTLLLEDYRFLHNYAAGHYIVLPRKVHADWKKLLKESRNLKVLEYDKKDNHALLDQSLSDLAARAEIRRSEIARNMDW